MAEVDLLEVVEVPLPENILVDPKQVVEGEVQHLRVELLNFYINTLQYNTIYIYYNAGKAATLKFSS